MLFRPAINLLPPQIAASLTGTGLLGALITVVYLMTILAYLFFTWMDYFLDFWMITPTRIIAINQRGFFDRVVSEIPLDRVQDAEMEVVGIIETLLHFGTLRIQTAGEQPFIIANIPSPTSVKAAIFANR
ncbi:MAG: PH domain-containing protein [bacterium]|nr:PH domain-containing protein [bacterium]MDZ4299832.1 PH domain-containing protein [Candidatus Sungbacteria bacterium]